MNKGMIVGVALIITIISFIIMMVVIYQSKPVDNTRVSSPVGVVDNKLARVNSALDIVVTECAKASGAMKSICIDQIGDVLFNECLDHYDEMDACSKAEAFMVRQG